MRPLRRPRQSTIHYHGREDWSDYSALTFSINGVRWVYHLRPQQADDCAHIVRVASAAKGLAYAKARATVAAKLDKPSPAAATFLRHRGAQASRARRIKVTLPNV
jgi:hypothetical protein